MEAKTIKVSIQGLDKTLKNSSTRDHRHDGLDETLEEILNCPVWKTGTMGRGRSMNPSLAEAH